MKSNKKYGFYWKKQHFLKKYRKNYKKVFTNEKKYDIL